MRFGARSLQHQAAPSADSLLNLSTEVKSGSLVVTFENLGNVTKDKLEGLPSQVHPVPPF